MHPKLEKYQLNPEQTFLFGLLHGKISDQCILPPGFSEKEFIKLVRRHRLIPALSNRDEIQQLDISGLMKKHKLRNTKKMLQYTVEIEYFQRLFTENNITFLFIKGPALAKSLYYNISDRECIDVDIVVRPKDYKKALSLLSRYGYIASTGTFSTPKNWWLKDAQLFHHKKNVMVELHYSLFFNAFWAKRFDWEQNMSKIQLQNTSVNVLSDSVCFLYLVLHGAMHQWFRLFWLRDIATFLEFKISNNWREIISIAKKIGAERCLIQAVYLSNVFFNTAIPYEIQQICKNKKIHQKLIDEALQAIINPVNETFIRRIKRLKYLLYLNSNPAYKWNVFTGGVARFLLFSKKRIGRQ